MKHLKVAASVVNLAIVISLAFLAAPFLHARHPR